jgi:hypothetical protein
LAESNIANPDPRNLTPALPTPVLKKENTMLTRYFALIGLTAALLISSGCSAKETMLDRNWGSSFESAKSNQILDPEAGKNLDPVLGLDGQAVGISMEKYRQGFNKEKSEGLSLTINNK